MIRNAYADGHTYSSNRLGALRTVDLTQDAPNPLPVSVNAASNWPWRTTRCAMERTN